MSFNHGFGLIRRHTLTVKSRAGTLLVSPPWRRQWGEPMEKAVPFTAARPGEGKRMGRKATCTTDGHSVQTPIIR